MQTKKILIIVLVGMFLIGPAIGLAAQSPLQQTYPSVDGTELNAGTSASESIPRLVKYLFNLAVWLCILAAILTLIIGGIQYLTASGQVNKMAGAKTRIYGSLLGLAILIGAWFVLHTMNPSLVIPKITYVPIKQGIVFFTKDGYCRFMGNRGTGCSGAPYDVEAGIINDLVQANQAKFINYSIPDLTTEFGHLVVANCPDGGTISWPANWKGNFPQIEITNVATATLDFADFEPYTFAFWGKKAQGAKLTFYNKPQYQTYTQTPQDLANLSYDYRGLLGENGEPVPGLDTIQQNPKIKDAIVVDPEYFHNISGRDQGTWKKYFTKQGKAQTISFLADSATKFLNASNYFNFTTDELKRDFRDKFSGTIQISKCGVPSISPNNFFSLMANPEFRSDENSKHPELSVAHPPLSVKIIWSTPGVYLLAQNGDERYFDSSAKDFKDINFDQMAQDIKIINDVTRTYVETDENGNAKTKTETETHDFLAILHEGDNFSGKLKIYFEQRMYDYSGTSVKDIRSSKVSKNAIIPAYNICGSPIVPSRITGSNNVKTDQLFTLDKSIADTSGILLTTKLFKDVNFSFWQDYNFGHLPMVQFKSDGTILSESGFQKISKNEPIVLVKDNYNDNGEIDYGGGYVIKEETRYGNLDKAPASVEVFELSQNPGASGECQEVKICTGKSGRGYCLAYTAENNKTDDDNTVYYPMPKYLPVPLPFASQDLGENCPDNLLPKFTGSDGTTKKTQEFANNIKSIIIKPEGKCAVVLMGGMTNPSWWSVAGNFVNFIYRTKNSNNKNKVFTNSDYNLEDNEIGECGSTLGFGRWLSQSCAAAIAVYPIK